MESEKIEKLVVLTDYTNYSGANRLLFELARAFIDKNVPTSLLTSHFDPKKTFKLSEKLNIITHDTKWLSKIFGRFQDILDIAVIHLLLFFFMISKQIRSASHVLLHSNGVLIIPFLKLFGYKVIFYLHFPLRFQDEESLATYGFLGRQYRRFLHKWEEYSMSIADVVMANSNFTLESTKKMYKSVDDKSKKNDNYLNLLYPCADENIIKVDTSQVSKMVQDKVTSDSSAQLKDEKNSLENNDLNITSLIREIEGSTKKSDKTSGDHQKTPFIFTSINRYSRDKNLELAIDSFEILVKKIKKNKGDENHLPMLVLIGGLLSNEHEYFNHLVQKIDSLGLKDNVFLLHSVSDSVIKYILAKTSCLLYTPEREHFGIVPLEAMLFSIPTIAVNSAGPKETVVNNETGFLTASNPEDFGLRMFEFFEDRDLLVRIGKKANERYYSVFSYEIFSKSLVSILHNVGFDFTSS